MRYDFTVQFYKQSNLVKHWSDHWTNEIPEPAQCRFNQSEIEANRRLLKQFRKGLPRMKEVRNTLSP